MKREIKTFRHFDRQLKRLLKKFRSLRGELNELSEELIESPKQGKDLGAGLYKIRLGSKSKNTGKGGGFRVVTYYVEQTGDDETVYLVTIYDKSEEDSITKADLLAFVKEAFESEFDQEKPDND